MSRLAAATVLGVSAFVMIAVGGSTLQAARHGVTLAVTMTNDPDANRILVYDADTHHLLQSLPTRGKGGVGGNAGGVDQLDGELVAAVNSGSGTVALFKRAGNRLRFVELVTTTSAPVSIDFAGDHMYVAGTTTVDSFLIQGRGVDYMDGTTGLVLAGGGAPPAGSTAQVGVFDESHLLVTLKTDPDPGTVDVVALEHGAVSGAAPTAVSAPAGTLTPFGFASYGDGTAVITLAHSNQDGLFRDGAFVDVTAAGQGAPCWMTRAGKYVFSANTASGTISRLIGTGSHVFVDSAVAATLATGGAPTDVDAGAGLLGVIDHAGGQSHLSLFGLNVFGELTPAGAPITLGVANANGLAIVPSGDSDRD